MKHKSSIMPEYPLDFPLPDLKVALLDLDGTIIGPDYQYTAPLDHIRDVVVDIQDRGGPSALAPIHRMPSLHNVEVNLA